MPAPNRDKDSGGGSHHDNCIIRGAAFRSYVRDQHFGIHVPHGLVNATARRGLPRRAGIAGGYSMINMLIGAVIGVGGFIALEWWLVGRKPSGNRGTHGIR